MAIVTEHHHHHRDISGGAARAAVFGVSDGLLSNVSLILGVAGADPAPSVVRLAGLAGLVAGAFSMAVGEYLSVSAQVELTERELRLERNELRVRPAKELAELAALYESRGVRAEVAQEVATALMADPEQALEIHAREELGVDPNNLGSPIRAAVASFGAFVIGAFVPLIPWLAVNRTTGTAVLASIVLAAIGATTVGFVLARFTGGKPWKAAARQVGLAAISAAVAYAVGSLVGVTGAV
jgi:VIT1/CCC1 family predicted Fe2+/Mn2+ transporter